jgi:hypothetical protein
MAAACALLFLLVGCGQSDGDGQQSAATQTEPNRDSTIHVDADETGYVTPAGYTQETADPFRASLRALQPLQVLVGTWQGLTVRAIGGAKAIESPERNWDSLTDPQQPALVLKSKSSPYLKQARLTYRPERRVFHLFVTTANGSERILEGSFTQPPNDAANAKGDLERTFQLRLVQVTPEANAEALVITQEHNDCYRLDVHRKAGDSIALYDTVEANREGPHMTLPASKADPELCAVSGGKGTIPLLFDGKMYHVCCEGCKAAFMADPHRWIAAFEQNAQIGR